MSYEIINKAVERNTLPLIMQMNKLSPSFIHDSLIMPIKNHITIEKEKHNETPEGLLLNLFSNASLEDKDSINFIFNECKKEGITLSNRFYLNLFEDRDIRKYSDILSEQIKNLNNIFKLGPQKSYVLGDVKESNTMLCIHKKDLQLAKKVFLEENETIENLLTLLRFEHLSLFSEFQYSLNPTKSKDEYYMETYEKMIEIIFDSSSVFKRYHGSYDSKRLVAFNNSYEKYEQFMLDNMPKMSEDLLYKSLLVGFKDESIYEKYLPKVLKKLKITKSSLEYANMVVDSLDNHNHLKRYKNEFYKFPENFWEKNNLLENLDNGLSRGMKMLMDLDNFSSDWDSKSIDKVREIYKSKIYPHINDIYKDYIDRRCFESLEYKKQIGDAASSDKAFNYMLEMKIDIKDLIKDYLKTDNPNELSEVEENKIKNVVDFYLSKAEFNSDSIYLSRKGRFSKNYYPLIYIHKYPEEVFNVLGDFKDIVIQHIKDNNSCFDNNILLYALASGYINKEDFEGQGIVLNNESLNNPTENDLRNSQFKIWLKRESETFEPLKMIFINMSSEFIKNTAIIKEELELDSLVPRVSSKNSVRVNKF